MTMINLLNWREKRRQVQNNRFFFIVGLAVFGSILFVMFVGGVISQIIGANQADVAYLTSEISAVEQKINLIKDLQSQKDLLLARRQVIEALEDSRPFVVKIFDNLARIVPAGIILTEMSRKDDKLNLSGTGDTNSDVSEFLIQIQKLRWVTSAKIKELKLAGSNKVSDNKNTEDSRVEFQIEIVLASLNAALNDATKKATLDQTPPDATTKKNSGKSPTPKAPAAGKKK